MNDSDALQTRYRGTFAKTYEADRTRGGVRRFKWRQEQKALLWAAGHFAPESTVLDVPAGTGRSLGILSAAARTVIGCDISPDMLSLAKASPEGHALPLVVGDVTKLPLADKSVDWVVSMRFANLVPTPVLRAALDEMSRVSTRGIVVQIRLRGGRGAFMNGLILANRWARRVWRRPGAADSPEQPLPTQAQFDRLLDAAGLRVRAIHRVVSPLDSQYLAVLVKSHAAT